MLFAQLWSLEGLLGGRFSGTERTFPNGESLPVGAVALILLCLLKGRLTGLAVQRDGLPFDGALGGRLGRNSRATPCGCKIVNS